MSDFLFVESDTINLPQEDFTAEAVIQVAEFFVAVIIIILQIKGTLSSWKEAFSIWDIVWDNIILGI